MFSKLIKSVVSIILLATGLVFSQECDLTLTGKVINLYDNTPLEAAVIEVVGKKNHSVSTVKGEFTINNLCPGKLVIKISHLNCEDLYEDIDLTESTYQTFNIEHHIHSLNEVVIEDYKTNLASPTAKAYVLSESQKDRYSGEGLAQALEQISGVSSLATGSGLAKPIIHGMFGSRVGIIYDNILLENQQWGQDHAPNIDLNAFENLQIVKGTGTLKYSGDTPGGIIILKSAPIEPIDSLYGKTILNGMSNGKGGSITSSWIRSFKDGTYFKAQGTYKRRGDYSTPDYVLRNTAGEEKNISLAVGKNNLSSKWKMYFSYFNNEVGILRSSHIGNVNDLLRAMESETPLVIRPFSYDITFPKQTNKHFTTNVQYTKIIKSNDQWNVKYSWQKNNRKEFDIRRGDYKNIAALNLNLDTHNLTSNYEWDSSLGSFDSGVFMLIQDNYSNPNTGVRRLIPDYIKFKTGSYFTATLRPKGFTIGLGLRYEHTNNEVQKYYTTKRWNSENYEETLGRYVTKEINGDRLVKRRLFFNTLSFYAGLKHNLSAFFNLGINYNFSQRGPDIAEMFSDGLHHALATIEYGNPFLTEETTQKIVVDFEKKKGDFQFNISPYLTVGNDYIIIEPSGIERNVRGAFPVWEYKSIDATIKGVDLDMTYAFNKNIQLKHNSSWIEGTNKTDNVFLINTPPLTIKNTIRFSVPKSSLFSVELHSQQVFRQNRFPDNNFDTVVVEDGNYITKTVDVSTPPAGYNKIGADLNWGPYPASSGKINISLSFDNLLNTSYRNYLNRLRFYADEHGRNVMLQIKFNH